MTANTDLLDALTALRAQAPLVHCMTNFVAMNVAANVVLAAGASPAMVHAPEEVQTFTPMAGALTVNIGTLSESWLTSMRMAAEAAGASDTPWVLDPVALFITPWRMQAARDLLALKPAVVRGNASEILALAGQAGAGKGADSGDDVTDAIEAARALAKAKRCVVAVTGVRDFVTDGTRHVWISGGSPIMPRVTALGCALTALVGAFVAVAPPFEGTVAAMTMFAEAGARAGEVAQGPGSFQVALLDALANVTPEDLADGGRVEWA
ncbi:hydroxyethylthiazole kinase [Jannaschia faecimaris]|uniref:Hydroxyethylthiazole kinase n=1 Tax=Jannaschia faecimaris TaxID=1244108 RepID=A0A1H3TCX4_9RHOB|nr:hydroxyethylthiazole kinase [Jannaschia faecimaris]SDZ47807.1 hydroxyethylthiazole kinase [Jannaschia faecimaris]